MDVFNDESTARYSWSTVVHSSIYYTQKYALMHQSSDIQICPPLYRIVSVSLVLVTLNTTLFELTAISIMNIE